MIQIFYKVVQVQHSESSADSSARFASVSQ